MEFREILEILGTRRREKAAEVLSDLKPHQQRVLDRLQNQSGLVVAHGLGSGKTLTALAAADAIGGDANFIVPASLAENLQKEQLKHLKSPSFRKTLDTLQRTGLHRGENLTGGDLLVVDEAHRLREPGVTSKALKERAKDYDKRLLLTATPVYNRPSDIAPLVNLAAGNQVLPEGKGFDNRYIREKTVRPGIIARLRGARVGTRRSLQRKGELRDTLQQWVDYHDNPPEGFPRRTDQEVKVPMGASQYTTYRGLTKDSPFWMRAKVESGLPPEKAELGQLNAFLSGLRQTSLSEHGFVEGLSAREAAERSAKITRAANSLIHRAQEDPSFRGLVYSNYLQAGLEPYSTLLEERGVPYGMFTGSMPKKAREQMVRDYNDGKIQALLVSSAGGEGLDLKGTRKIQVLEPHWNQSKVDQVIGRGIRYGSHAHLPEDQREVLVEHYLATPPLRRLDSLRKLTHNFKNLFRTADEQKEWTGPFSADQYMRSVSQEKTRLNDEVLDLMRTKTSEDAPLKGQTLSKALDLDTPSSLGEWTGRLAGTSLGSAALIPIGILGVRHVGKAGDLVTTGRLAKAFEPVARRIGRDRLHGRASTAASLLPIAAGIGAVLGGREVGGRVGAWAENRFHERRKTSAREVYLDVEGERVPFSQYFGSDDPSEVLLQREMRDLLAQSKQRPQRALSGYKQIKALRESVPGPIGFTGPDLLPGLALGAISAPTFRHSPALALALPFTAAGAALAVSDAQLREQVKKARNLGDRGYKAREEMQGLVGRLRSLPKGTSDNEEARSLLLREFKRTKGDLDTIYSDDMRDAWAAEPSSGNPWAMAGSLVGGGLSGGVGGVALGNALARRRGAGRLAAAANRIIGGYLGASAGVAAGAFLQTGPHIRRNAQSLKDIVDPIERKIID